MAEEVGYPIGKRKRGGGDDGTPGSLDKKTEEKKSIRGNDRDEEDVVVNKDSALMNNDRDRSRSSRHNRDERSRDGRRRSNERRDTSRSRGSSDRRR